MLEELDAVFNSPTIKPSYELAHVILALIIFGENDTGIGRYRLEKELSIGSGTAKSLVKRLSKPSKFITILNDENKRRGHVLTEKGQKFLQKIKSKIPLIEQGDLSLLKDIIIESQEVDPYFCLIKNAAKDISSGIEQRDAAIKIGGTGATCLSYDGKYFIFPQKLRSEKDEMMINERIQEYFKNKIQESNASLNKDDIIIIGLGLESNIARLSALNAALTLI